MSEEKTRPPIEPLRYFLIGIAYPGLVILALTAMGALVFTAESAFGAGRGTFAPQQILRGAKIGMLTGFLLSFFAVFDIAAGLMASERRFMNGVYQALGYLAVWVGVGYAVGAFDGTYWNIFD